MNKYITVCLFLGLSCLATTSIAGEKTDEYINRIAKRITMVSDQPQINYEFHVLESETPGLAFDQETNTILVSTAILDRLHDEAELAAVLNLGLVKYGNLPDPDISTINNLYRAGYDPQALIDLQEQYLFSSTTRQDLWLSTLYQDQITPSTVTYNKSIISNIPKGLLRGADKYSQFING